MIKQKGIVFENTSSYSIFLTDDGRFLKGIPDSLSEVGEEVSFRPYVEMVAFKKPKRTAYMAPLIAAVAIVFMFFSVLIPSQSKVSAYVQMDFNPSIELGIDSKGDVQVFRGLNEDGVALKRDISFWKGKSLTWVMSKIVSESNVSFEDESQFGITTIISENQNQVALEKIITTAITRTTVKVAPEKIRINQATNKERLQANEKGVSVETYKESQGKVNKKEKSLENQPVTLPKEKEAKEKENSSNQGKANQNKNRDQPKKEEKNNGEKNEQNDQLKNKDQKINNGYQSKKNDQKNSGRQNNNNNKTNSNDKNKDKNKDKYKNKDIKEKASNSSQSKQMDQTRNNERKVRKSKDLNQKKNDFNEQSSNKSHNNQKGQKQNKNDHPSKNSNGKKNDR